MYNYYRPPTVAYQQGHGLGSLFRAALPVVKSIFKSKALRSAVKTATPALRKYGPRVLKAGSRIARAKNRKEAVKREIQRQIMREMKRKQRAGAVPRRDVFTKL